MMRRQMMLGLVVVLLGVVGAAAEGIAQGKIAYICWEGTDFAGNRSVCVADLDGSNVVRRIGVLSCVFRTTATRHYDK